MKESVTSLLKAVAFCNRWKPRGSTNRKYTEAKDEYLPPEIWERIFLELPVKSLGKCMCVCKVWKSIVTDRDFILDHSCYRRANSDANHSLLLQYRSVTHRLDRSNIISEQHLLVSSDDDKEASCLAIITTPLHYEAMPDLKVVGTCNGLVCILKYSKPSRHNRLIIMNLSIRKYVVLPELNRLSKGYMMVGFGYDSRNEDFKVVVLVGRIFECAAQVEVCSLASGKWRSISHAGIPSIGFCNPHGWLRSTNVVFVNGALHWLFCGCYNGRHRTFISRFDLGEETFGEIKLPNCWDEGLCEGASLLVVGSCLALSFSTDHSGRNVWVMRKYGVVDSWDLVFSDSSRHYQGLDIERVLGLRSSQEIVVQTRDQRILLLDERLNKETVKDLQLQNYKVGFAADHVGSLFFIDQQHDNAHVKGEDVIDVRFVSLK